MHGSLELRDSQMIARSHCLKPNVSFASWEKQASLWVSLTNEPKYPFSSIFDNYYEYLFHTFFITNYWFVLSWSLLPTCLSFCRSLSLAALHPPFGPGRRRPGCSRVVPGPTLDPRVLSKSYSTIQCLCSTPNQKIKKSKTLNDYLMFTTKWKMKTKLLL